MLSVECGSICYVGLMQMKEEEAYLVELDLNSIEGRKPCVYVLQCGSVHCITGFNFVCKCVCVH